jgi:hypothetical protein
MLGFGPISSTAISASTVPSISPDIVNFTALSRQALVSGGPIAFDALSRQALISGKGISFAGVAREVLISGSKVAFAGLVRELLTIGPGPVFTFGPIPIFPALPEGWPIKVSPSMDTIIGTTKSLREMRVAQRQTPLWDIEILFEELKDQTQNQLPYAPFVGYQQYEQLVQLWLSMYGQTNVFGFDCPWDDSREDQFIGNGDGATTIFTIYRTWGLGAQATLAPIGLINEVFDVQVNGVPLVESQYSVVRNKIYFNFPPASGQPITMSFSFYYLCRFVADEQDFEEFAKDRWTVPSLKFRAVYWP